MKKLSRGPVAILVCLSVAAAVAGCASFYVKPGVAYHGTRHSYNKVLENWTREAAIYQGLETVAMFHATYLSKEFLDAFSRETARAKNLSQDQKEKIIARAMEEHNNSLRFVVALFTSEKHLNDLDSRTSSWGVTLINSDGNRVEPQRIRKIAGMPYEMRVLYPYIDEWSEIYEIDFPPALAATQAPTIREGSGSFTLEISGAAGQVDMRWSFEKK